MQNFLCYFISEQLPGSCGLNALLVNQLLLLVFK